MILAAVIAGLIALGYVVATAVLFWADRRMEKEMSDPRVIDLLRRGEVIPWPVDGDADNTERKA